MILDLDKKKKHTTALIDASGDRWSYGELHTRVVYDFPINKKPRPLVFILCKNEIQPIVFFLSCLHHGAVPLLLNADINELLLHELIQIYSPTHYLAPEKVPLFNHLSHEDYDGYVLCELKKEPPLMNSQLSFLLSTSGSTGSPKLVRHKADNIITNVKNVSRALEITPNDRAIAALPVYFTQGLSTVCANLYAGASVLLTTHPLTTKPFWDFIKEYEATSFSGIPYSFEILDRLRFCAMKLPTLTTINQGGGRLTNEMFSKFASYAQVNKKKFIATYGSTETTSRMAYLPHHMAVAKTGSVGIAMPYGNIKLLDEKGSEITTPHVVGEILYSGGNVTLGYATCVEDLQNGDERNGKYSTGDLAYFDEDDCLFIVGRKTRFVKLFGFRIGLDDIERMIKNEITPDCATIGNAKIVTIFLTDTALADKTRLLISNKTGIHISGFEIKIINVIPKNNVGKTLYTKLEEL